KRECGTAFSMRSRKRRVGSSGRSIPAARKSTNTRSEACKVLNSNASDKAYGSAVFRALLESHGLKACIPPKANERNPPKYHQGHYRKRHHVENFFQRIKESRAIATRYEKPASRYLGLVKLAAIGDWLKK
ncbi:MAG: transposase, partial [Verrucomicrobiales bacterium]|nr:transposase [Verrucomicrobiales bacterium]